MHLGAPRRASLGSLVVALLAVTSVLVAVPAVAGPPTSLKSALSSAGGGSVDRISGTDRFDTAARVSASAFSVGVPVAYVANGYNFPDALAGGPVAALQGGPVLLTAPGSIPQPTASELLRLKPGRIVVLGGTAAISDAVATALAQYTVGTVTRIAGGDRFSTAADVSATQFTTDVPVAFVANGYNFPDALAGGPIAALQGGPVLLTAPGSLPGPTAAELTRLHPHKIVILGGTSAVSSAVASALASYTTGSVARIAGGDRFETAALSSASQFMPNVPVVYVANGYNFPDALAGGPAASLQKGPVLLTAPDSLPASTAAELTRLNPKKIVVLGGTSAVSSAVATTLNDYQAPGAVSGLIMTAASGHVTLQWTNPTSGGFDGVIIRRLPGTTPPASPTDGTGVTTSDATGTAYTDVKLSTSGTYTYALFTKNAVGAVSSGVSGSLVVTVPRVLTGAGLFAASGYAAKSDGTLWAWGGNEAGQLGDGTTTDTWTPALVSGLTNVQQVASGYEGALALRSDGTVWAWGVNYYGQLGNGTTNGSSVPVQVQGLANVVAIADAGITGYALKSDGTVWAWGGNFVGQLGNGTTGGYSSVPAQAPGLTNVTSISRTGAYVVKSDGTVWAWGLGGQGQLGNGSNTDSNVPVQVQGLDHVVAVSSGDQTAYALKSDGTVWAWGAGSLGELGNGSTSDSPVAVQVSGLSNVQAVSAGNEDGYALKTDGTVWAWGTGEHGELGNGSTADSAIPVQVPGLTGIEGVFSTGPNAYALKQDGTVWAWGTWLPAYVPNGSDSESTVPVQVWF